VHNKVMLESCFSGIMGILYSECKVCMRTVLRADMFENRSSVLWNRTGRLTEDWLCVEAAPADAQHPQITLTDEEQERITALEATLSPALHAAAMVSAFIAGHSESSLFGVLEQLARARCSCISSNRMHTQPRGSKDGLDNRLKFCLAYDLYDSSGVRANEQATQAYEGVPSMPTKLSF
jgi:hypothetical protein